VIEFKVLIPVLSKQENSDEFIKKATLKAKEIIVLLIIDTQAMSGSFGFASGEMLSGRKIMDEVCQKIGKKRKNYEDLVEWGTTINKIKQIAIIRKVNKIVLLKQNNEYFKKLLKELKKEKDYELELVELK